MLNELRVRPTPTRFPTNILYHGGKNLRAFYTVGSRWYAQPTPNQNTSILNCKVLVLPLHTFYSLLEYLLFVFKKKRVFDWGKRGRLKGWQTAHKRNKNTTRGKTDRPIKGRGEEDANKRIILVGWLRIHYFQHEPISCRRCAASSQSRRHRRLKSWSRCSSWGTPPKLPAQQKQKHTIIRLNEQCKNSFQNKLGLEDTRLHSTGSG